MTSTKFWQRNSAAAKLNEAQVYEMRMRYASGRVTQGQLSRDYGVSVVQVGRIVRGEVWQKLAPLPPTSEQIDASAARLMEVQRSTALERMAEDVKREQTKEGLSDAMLEELARPHTDVLKIAAQLKEKQDGAGRTAETDGPDQHVVGSGPTVAEG